MLNQISKFPAFDLLEATPELIYTPQAYEKLNPIQAGHVLPELLNHQPAQTLNVLSGAYSPHQAGVPVPYLNKILVVYFYSKHWGSVSLAHLKQLNTVRNEVKYQDGHLVIIDSDGPGSSLQQLLWNNNLSLPVYADHTHQIASLFSVYAENSPTWNYYAGIDVNIPLPAVYVLNHFLKVVLDHSNEDISTNLPTDEIVTAVYQSNHYQAGRKSA